MGSEIDFSTVSTWILIFYVSGFLIFLRKESGEVMPTATELWQRGRLALPIAILVGLIVMCLLWPITWSVSYILDFDNRRQNGQKTK